MGSYYELRIESEKSIVDLEDNLGRSMRNAKNYWSLIIDESNDLFESALDYIVSLIKKNEKKLFELNLFENNSISIWCIYEFEEQCNLEFDPKFMYYIGRQNITLCISCWNK